MIVLKGNNGVAKVENRLREVILEMKEKHGIKTQKELAEKVGMDEGKLSRFLRMQTSELVNTKVLQALLDNFDLTPNDVLLVPEDKE
jgi:DNA-binding Xre family transcriptional regulator